MTTVNYGEVAKIILAQIRASDKWALGDWGVIANGYPIVALDTGLGGIRFKTAGAVKWKGWVEITLNGLDLYDLRFYRIRKKKDPELGIPVDTLIVDEEISDIYCDMLVDVIDRRVLGKR